MRFLQLLGTVHTPDIRFQASVVVNSTKFHTIVQFSGVTVESGVIAEILVHQAGSVPVETDQAPERKAGDASTVPALVSCNNQILNTCHSLPTF